ncbi:MAG TPA: hypothetical protein VFB16_15995 [Bauldia sp.]|nr:hypothetical protein [Bauldia sp.]
MLFVHGFDPRGIERPYHILSAELPKYGARTGTAVGQSRLETPDRAKPWLKRWTVTVDEGDGATETRFEFLDWQDLIPRRREFRFFKLSLAAIATFYVMLWKGVFYRLARYGWSHFGFVAVPFAAVALYIGLIVAAPVAGYFIGRDFGGWGAAAGLALGLLAAAVFYRLTLWIDRGAHFWFLMAFWAFQREQGSRRGMPVLAARFDRLAEHALHVADEWRPDEAILVGVSHGGICAIDILGRMFERDPGLAALASAADREGRRLAFLTLGSLPSLLDSMGPNPGLRAATAKLLASPLVDWHYYTARGDIMTSDRYDPFRDLGRRPTPAEAARFISFRILLKPMLGEAEAALGWRFITKHLQYLMASVTGEEYDFFALTCTGTPFRTAAAAWRSRALASRTGDG